MSEIRLYRLVRQSCFTYTGLIPIEESTIMNTELVHSPAPSTPGQAVRHVVRWARGHRHGPITRLMSPGDLGQLLKPFVFLDLFDTQGAQPGNMGLHPHSGIATLTWITEGSVDYEDTSGRSGVLSAGGVEWMVAGAGVWHGGGWSGEERARGFQLWIALPAALEHGPAGSTYLAPEVIPRVGPARLLLGAWEGVASVVAAPSDMLYLAVSLKAGQSWRFQPPAGHTVSWIAVSEGQLRAPETVVAGELAVFEASDGAIEFHADADSDFVLGSAVPHPHPLALGSYSVHTSTAALHTGETRIREIGQQLRAAGRLR
jgi:redox-sensitive bicupin YhaK (pirin superfamily)